MKKIYVKLSLGCKFKIFGTHRLLELTFCYLKFWLTNCAKFNIGAKIQLYPDKLQTKT
jgi:hypothetical protein